MSHQAATKAMPAASQAGTQRGSGERRAARRESGDAVCCSAKGASPRKLDMGGRGGEGGKREESAEATHTQTR